MSEQSHSQVLHSRRDVWWYDGMCVWGNLYFFYKSPKNGGKLLLKGWPNSMINDLKIIDGILKTISWEMHKEGVT